MRENVSKRFKFYKGDDDRAISRRYFLYDLRYPAKDIDK